MTETPKLTIPTVHLNGTSKDTLMQQVLRAKGALLEAIVELDAAAPNGRDYYVQGDGVFGQVQREHLSRAQRLDSVLQELNAIAEGIADQRG